MVPQDKPSTQAGLGLECRFCRYETSIHEHVANTLSLFKILCTHTNTVTGSYIIYTHTFVCNTATPILFGRSVRTTIACKNLASCACHHLPWQLCTMYSFDQIHYTTGWALYTPNVQWGKVKLNMKKKSSTRFNVTLNADQKASCTHVCFTCKHIHTWTQRHSQQVNCAA